MTRPVGLNLQEPERRAIISLYLEGMATSEIADHVGVSKSTVTRLTLREGLREPVAVNGRKLTAGQIRLIKNMYTSTYYPLSKISYEASCSYDSVVHHTQGLERGLSAPLQDLICQRYNSGDMTASDIRKEYGVNQAVLFKIVRDKNES